MDFELARPSRQQRTGVVLEIESCDSWRLPTLISNFWASDISLFGATHVHTVSDARSLHWPAVDGEVVRFPNWHPFASGDENATFRFELSA